MEELERLEKILKADRLISQTYRVHVADLKAIVKAVENGEPWEHLLTPEQLEIYKTCGEKV